MYYRRMAAVLVTCYFSETYQTSSPCSSFNCLSFLNQLFWQKSDQVPLQPTCMGIGMH